MRESLDGGAGSSQSVADALPVLRPSDRNHGQKPACDVGICRRIGADPSFPRDVDEAFELVTCSGVLAEMIQGRRLVGGNITQIPGRICRFDGPPYSPPP